MSQFSSQKPGGSNQDISRHKLAITFYSLTKLSHAVSKTREYPGNRAYRLQSTASRRGEREASLVAATRASQGGKEFRLVRFLNRFEHGCFHPVAPRGRAERVSGTGLPRYDSSCSCCPPALFRSHTGIRWPPTSTQMKIFAVFTEPAAGSTSRKCVAGCC